jgi:signal transduction histidine kinase
VIASVARLLRRDLPRIIEAWTELEREAGVPDMPDAVLVDSMPALLEAIALHLEQGKAAPCCPFTLHAEKHAEQRLARGSSLDQVTLEYTRLRRALVRVIGRAMPSVSAEAWEALHAALDMAVAGAVSAYLRRRTEEMEVEQDQLRRALEFRERVIGIVSHDLRNPLNAILLAAQLLLLKGERDARERRTIQRIVGSAQRATRMIHDLLDYSRARLGGGIPIERQPARMDEVVQQVVDEAAAAIPDRVFSVAREEGASFEGEWDRDRVAQALLNLVRNAVQHSLANTPIRVRLAASREEVVVEVHNEGDPIDPALVPSLFEAFKQGPARGAHEGNVGLGLYITSEVVRGHAGHIEVVSTREHGTSFRVHLPRRALAGG